MLKKLTPLLLVATSAFGRTELPNDFVYSGGTPGTTSGTAGGLWIGPNGSNTVPQSEFNQGVAINLIENNHPDPDIRPIKNNDPWVYAYCKQDVPNNTAHSNYMEVRLRSLDSTHTPIGTRYINLNVGPGMTTPYHNEILLQGKTPAFTSLELRSLTTRDIPVDSPTVKCTVSLHGVTYTVGILNNSTVNGIPYGISVFPTTVNLQTTTRDWSTYVSIRGRSGPARLTVSSAAPISFGFGKEFSSPGGYAMTQLSNRVGTFSGSLYARGTIPMGASVASYSITITLEPL